MQESFSDIDTVPTVNFRDAIFSVCRRVARIPYTNIAALLDQNNIPYNKEKYGGTCLSKLNLLIQMLRQEGFNLDGINYIVDTVNEHYALVFEFESILYYIDPFNWQAEPIPIPISSTIEHPTLVMGQTLELGSDGKNLKVTVKRGPVVLLNYDYSLCARKPIEELPLNIEPIYTNPNFQMLILDERAGSLYTIYFGKSKGQITHMYVTDTSKDELPKKYPIHRDNSNSKLRSIGYPLEDIEAFFREMYRLVNSKHIEC